MQTILVRPKAVWCGDGRPARDGVAVLIEDARIAAVGAEIVPPAGCVVLDLPGTTLLPGLIDAHAHLFLYPYDQASWDDQVLKQAEAYRTVRAVTHAEATLNSGFTCLRDLGTEGAGYADVALKRAIDEGLVPGPRLAVATKAIVASGCYGPKRSQYRPDCCLAQGAEEASGVDEIVRAVRHQAAHGADWIKLYGDYRVGPAGELRPTFAADELHAAVETAHDLGRPVAVHAMCDEAIHRAVDAGCDSIEHGYYASRETLRLMARRGCALLPTLTAIEAIAAYRGEAMPNAAMRAAAETFRAALEEGVTIGCGSDVGVFAHGTSRRELAWMVRLGMTTQEALMAATAVNARLLGRADELGRIASGCLADLVAVDGDPLVDIDALGRIALVVKNGILHSRKDSSCTRPSKS